ncbi:DUF2891 domain-containing protein [Phenylobacterium montanum]|uniref:DUF2891 domain-containing protein n=1 Tax=Phenylobacterium montanum TaxID=2823693 RepID=A0A975FYW1_9CAUL|nr:DUF2891 domain-containing protein [Caulobacter sp. S6]QUD87398.1 DUF2891 domain-containing protein [Caulobacter sp. S6]
MTQFTPDLASRFARIALGHVERRYPFKLDQVLLGPDDRRSPTELHPVFHGSFDWHSCVHGYWLLARIGRRFPDLPEAAEITALFDRKLTPELVAGERAYLDRPLSGGFERPYGWAWLLKLAAELEQRMAPAERAWAEALAPLAQAFADRFRAYLPKATYPVRAGVHSNTAFALRLALDYAEAVKDQDLAALFRHKALAWYGADADCQAWEPGGDDFLSPALIEAALMARALPAGAFVPWLDRFLPRLAAQEPGALFAPATVSDRTDGKIAHLDGVNLSRAWCLREVAAALPVGDARRGVLGKAAETHLAASLPHVASDYMGEHWLASFAALALETA